VNELAGKSFWPLFWPSGQNSQPGLPHQSLFDRLDGKVKMAIVIHESDKAEPLEEPPGN